MHLFQCYSVLLCQWLKQQVSVLERQAQKRKEKIFKKISTKNLTVLKKRVK